jgi:hypothetical protein
MEQFQERVVIEKHELDIKIDKLRGFTESSKFKTIPAVEQERMAKQFRLMVDYSTILGERIAAFS